MQFVIVDLEKTLPAAQQQLVKKYYRGSIPLVVVLDGEGNAVYNQAGEIGEAAIARLLDGQSAGSSK